MLTTDYIPVEVRSPLDGSAITIFNLRPEKLWLVDGRGGPPSAESQ